ncbi:Lrp/AsnC family transcriptional regulator [Granulicatella seriolae]|uniref:Lrp/AsnC family transcriptional regulator n=1 Tax=Granulicatella seriolae TaxID=2967226 RepID=A0ABT1WP73_9LACT|nr:Lrp/AsnC family transcriptional regulator [Granulicatella seriolae]
MKSDTSEQILKLLETDSRLTPEEIAVLLGLDAEETKKRIEKLEEENVICGYHTLINWEKTDDINVSAVIELRVNPQRGMGFDRIAEKIYQFPEVDALYLMSGGYDFMVQLKKAPMRDIASFVSNRLSIIEEVQSTATHVVLKQYKDHGTLFVQKSGDQRMVITP